MKKLSRVLLVLFIGLALMPLLISHAQTTWQPNTAYSTGDLVTYGGDTYKCLQAHTSLVQAPESCSSVKPEADARHRSI